MLYIKQKHSILEVKRDKNKKGGKKKKQKKPHKKQTTQNHTMNRDDHGPQTSLCVFENEI